MPELGEAAKVVPLGPRLRDPAVLQTVDCEVVRGHHSPGRWVWPQRPRLGSPQAVPGGYPVPFGDEVFEGLAGVREGLVLALQEPLQVVLASHTRLAGGVAVPDEVGHDKL